MVIQLTNKMAETTSLQIALEQSFDGQKTKEIVRALPTFHSFFYI